MFIFCNINNDDVYESIQLMLLNPKCAKLNEKWASKGHKTTTQMVYFLFSVPNMQEFLHVGEPAIRKNIVEEVT